MYLSYYNLKRKPFQVDADPKFLWLGKKHNDALAAMKYGVQYNHGYILITGDIGTGKTTLINALIKDLDEEVVVAKINDPDGEPLDFLNLVASAYGIDGPYTSKRTFLAAFNEYLRKCYANQRKVILIIDEAQRLSSEVLADIRHLSNVEEAFLNIVFVGQNEFNDRLLDRGNRALRQRIAINRNLDALTEEETKEYIAHRLEMAGSRGKKFTIHAIREIFLFSRGIPRLINIVSDRALLSGCVKQKKLIGVDIIKDCAEELRLPGEKIPKFREERFFSWNLAGEKNEADKEEIEQHASTQEEGGFSTDDLSADRHEVDEEAFEYRASMREDEEFSADRLSVETNEVDEEEFEHHGLKYQEERFVSPATYVIPVVALLLILTGYLHDPRLYVKFVESFELKSVKHEIAGELPSIRVEKPVSEILAPKADESVKMSKIEAEETGADVEASAASTEKASLENSIVNRASESSTEETTSILDRVEPAADLTEKAPLEKSILNIASESSTEETAPIQEARSGDTGQATALREEQGAPDPGEVIDWLLEKHPEN